MLKHFHQEGQTTCGAAAFRILLSDRVEITEKQAKKECRTGKDRKRGTFGLDVLSALRKRNIEAYYINLDVDFEEYSRWLLLNSIHRKLYLSCHFIDRACGGKGEQKGRGDAHRHHSIIASDGWIYDPSEDKPCPIEAYFDIYSKKLVIKTMILTEA